MLLKNVEVTKAAEIDQISEKFLNNGARILAKPISDDDDDDDDELYLWYGWPMKGV